jgi:hypothetical protein
MNATQTRYHDGEVSRLDAIVGVPAQKQARRVECEATAGVRVRARECKRR